MAQENRIFLHIFRTMNVSIFKFQQQAVTESNLITVTVLFVTTILQQQTHARIPSPIPSPQKIQESESGRHECRTLFLRKKCTKKFVKYFLSVNCVVSCFERMCDEQKVVDSRSLVQYI